MLTVSKRRIGSVALQDDLILQYVEQGDPHGIPVLLLHGYSDSLVSFTPLMQHLPDSIRAIALTQRGHGDSSWPVTGYAMRDFAADAVAFLDTLGIEQAVIAGHSMGSVIASRLAVDYPERVRGVLLVGAFHDPLGSRDDMQELRDAVRALSDPVDAAFVREFQESTIVQPVPQDFVELIVNESRKLPAFVWHAALAGLLAEDLTGEFAHIQPPVLIVWGDQDGLCSHDEQLALLRALPNARLVAYPGTGHAVQWEQPEQLAQDIMAFVASIAG